MLINPKKKKNKNKERKNLRMRRECLIYGAKDREKRKKEKRVYDKRREKKIKP
jgi:hypothetical protein